MTENYVISRKLLKSTIDAAQKLIKRVDQKKINLVEPLDNFVVWRAQYWNTGCQGKKILDLWCEGEGFILVWNEPKAP